MLQEDPGRASYSGTITGADSFTTSATDGCGTVTYQVEEITENSATMTYNLDFNGSCLVNRTPCNASFTGTVFRR